MATAMASQANMPSQPGSPPPASLPAGATVLQTEPVFLDGGAASTPVDHQHAATAQNGNLLNIPSPAQPVSNAADASGPVANASIPEQSTRRSFRGDERNPAPPGTKRVHIKQAADWRGPGPRGPGGASSGMSHMTRTRTDGGGSWMGPRRSSGGAPWKGGKGNKWKDMDEHADSRFSQLHHELSALVRLAVETENDKAKKQAAQAELLIVAQRLWGKQVSVLMHGSSRTSAALRKSDVDLVVVGVPDLPPLDLPGGSGYKPLTREKVATFLDRLHATIFEESDIAKEGTIVRHARMPLLKLAMASGVDVDLTLGGTRSIQTTDLLATLLAQFPLSKPLLLAFKAILKSRLFEQMRGLHVGGLSSFCATLMVIAFCKWRVVHTPNSEDLGEAFVEMLTFFTGRGAFDIRTHAIDVTAADGLAPKPESEHDLQELSQPQAEELRNRVCVLEPVGGQDIGIAAYRVPNCLERLREMLSGLLSANALSRCPMRQARALEGICAQDSYSMRAASASPGGHQLLAVSEAWLCAQLPHLAPLLSVGSLLPLSPRKAEAPRPEAPPPQGEPDPTQASGTFFVQGLGPVQLGKLHETLASAGVTLPHPDGHATGSTTTQPPQPAAPDMPSAMAALQIPSLHIPNNPPFNPAVHPHAATSPSSISPSKLSRKPDSLHFTSPAKLMIPTSPRSGHHSDHAAPADAHAQRDSHPYLDSTRWQSQASSPASSLPYSLLQSITLSSGRPSLCVQSWRDEFPSLAEAATPGSALSSRHASLGQRLSPRGLAWQSSGDAHPPPQEGGSLQAKSSRSAAVHDSPNAAPSSPCVDGLAQRGHVPGVRAGMGSAQNGLTPPMSIMRRGPNGAQAHPGDAAKAATPSGGSAPAATLHEPPTAAETLEVLAAGMAADPSHMLNPSPTPPLAALAASDAAEAPSAAAAQQRLHHDAAAAEQAPATPITPEDVRSQLHTMTLASHGGTHAGPPTSMTQEAELAHRPKDSDAASAAAVDASSTVPAAPATARKVRQRRPSSSSRTDAASPASSSHASSTRQAPFPERSTLQHPPAERDRQDAPPAEPCIPTPPPSSAQPRSQQPRKHSSAGHAQSPEGPIGSSGRKARSQRSATASGSGRGAAATAEHNSPSSAADTGDGLGAGSAPNSPEELRPGDDGHAGASTSPLERQESARSSRHRPASQARTDTPTSFYSASSEQHELSRPRSGKRAQRALTSMEENVPGVRRMRAAAEQQGPPLRGAQGGAHPGSDGADSAAVNVRSNSSNHSHDRSESGGHSHKRSEIAASRGSSGPLPLEGWGRPDDPRGRGSGEFRGRGGRGAPRGGYAGHEGRGRGFYGGRGRAGRSFDSDRPGRGSPFGRGPSRASDGPPYGGPTVDAFGGVSVTPPGQLLPSNPLAAPSMPHPGTAMFIPAHALPLHNVHLEPHQQGNGALQPPPHRDWSSPGQQNGNQAAGPMDSGPAARRPQRGPHPADRHGPRNSFSDRAPRHYQPPHRMQDPGMPHVQQHNAFHRHPPPFNAHRPPSSARGQERDRDAAGRVIAVSLPPNAGLPGPPQPGGGQPSAQWPLIPTDALIRSSAVVQGVHMPPAHMVPVSPFPVGGAYPPQHQPMNVFVPGPAQGQPGNPMPAYGNVMQYALPLPPQGGNVPMVQVVYLPASSVQALGQGMGPQNYAYAANPYKPQ